MYYTPTEAYDLTLNWVNELRQEKGLEPLDEMPKGDCLGGSCPIYKALADTGITWVGRSAMTTDPTASGPFEIDIPLFATSFIVGHAANNYKLYEVA